MNIRRIKRVATVREKREWGRFFFWLWAAFWLMRRSSANEGLLRFWVALAVDSLWAEGRFPVPRMFGIGRPGFLNCLFIHCKFFLKEKKKALFS